MVKVSDRPTEETVRRSVKQLNELATEYRKELANAQYTKVLGGFTSVLAIGAFFAPHMDDLVKLILELPAPVLAIRSLLRPCWKDLSDKDCFAAAVICEAESL